MIEIREVAAHDLPGIEAAYPISPGTPGNPHARRLDLHVQGDLSWLVAWDDARPCGSVTVRWPGGKGELTEQAKSLNCAEIGGLEVDEDKRRQGVASELMEAAEHLIRDRGLERVGLEVTASNPHQIAARALYAQRGFVDAGFGEFISGYTYHDAEGNAHRDEEPYRYFVKDLRTP